MARRSNIKKMLKDIETEARFTASYTGRDHFNKRVMKAMSEVLREKFVTEISDEYAYDDGPLPIGHGQTISQPYIVALMTDLLDLTEDSVVLEIGTGSGYQAAILSKLAKQVYSIERIPELCESATLRLKVLGYHNVETRCEDGYYGWSEKAPFDAIIVTAAAPYIPQTLIDQLKPGGRLVIPVGLPYMHQQLMLLTKDDQGKTDSQAILGVSFVPLIMEER